MSIRKVAAAALFLFPALTNAASAGRFELVQLGTAMSNQYLVDTQTGKIWRAVCAHNIGIGRDCDYQIWEPMDVIGISVTPDNVTRKVASMNPAPKVHPVPKEDDSE